MADIDVQPVGLTTPPQASYLQTYRPAVATRNNGLNPADVSGLLRIYDAVTGLLIFTTDLHVSAIQPGDTRNALGTTFWTPEQIGDYRVIATVSTPGDQVPSNDHLSPVTINVSEEPPPPPPPVEPHAPQHEQGGADEVSVDGLRGILADGQPIQPHAATHMVDGDDQMSVEGMPGELADEQKPKLHANEAHEPPFLDAIALAEHNTSQTAHQTSENLEHTARKGEPAGYASLDPDARVPRDQVNHAFPQLFLAEGPNDFIEIPPGEENAIRESVTILFPGYGQRVTAQALVIVRYEAAISSPLGWLRITISSNTSYNSASSVLQLPGFSLPEPPVETPFYFPLYCVCTLPVYFLDPSASVSISVLNQCAVPAFASIQTFMIFTHNPPPV